MPTLNVTNKSALDYAIPEKWEVKVRKDAARKAFWSKFEGAEGAGMPIIKRNDFTKSPGDTVHIQVLSQLGGDGVTGESTLAGNEEKLVLGQFDLTVDWLRHAVAFTEKATKEANFNAIMAANGMLSTWLARRNDSDMFAQLITTASPDTLYSGDATTEETLGTNDTFGTTEIDRIKVALMRKGALPIRIIKKGKQELPVYGVVISEMDEYNLRADTVWNESNRVAMLRGEENPLFTGALGMYNGVLVYTHYGMAGYQGTPIRPEASIYDSHNDSVGTITVGVSTAKNYTRFFTSTGTIAIVNASKEKEFVSYTGKTNNTFTGCSRGATYNSDAADGASAYVTGNLITQSNHVSMQVAFGAEIAAKSYGMYPTPIKQSEDYDFEKGVGVKMVYGQKAIEDAAGDKPNYLLVKSYAGNPNNS